MKETSQGPVSRTHAVVRQGRWPGWIWAIPLATVAIVVWLLVRQFAEHGVEVTVTFGEAAEMDPDNTKVVERGVQIGKVRRVRLTDSGDSVEVTLNIEDREKGKLTQGTRFYLEGAHPQLSDLSSLKALLGGPTIDMMPGPGKPTRHFSGILGEAPKRLAVAVPYTMSFETDTGDVKIGAPVMLKGFTVGEVTSVELRVSTDGQIGTRVGLALDPTRFHIDGAPAPPGDWRALLDQTLRALVKRGVRGRLSQSPPVIGAPQIELALIEDAKPAEMTMVAGEQQIPTTEGKDIGHFIQAVGSVPVQQIGDNVRAITEQVKSLTGSPQLRESIRHLNSSVAQLDATLRQVGPQIGPAVQSARQTIDHLRQTAADLDQAVKAVRTTVGADEVAPEGSLQPTLMHVSEAARSIRVLADYLDQHPEALLKGRGDADK